MKVQIFISFYFLVSMNAFSQFCDPNTLLSFSDSITNNIVAVRGDSNLSWVLARPSAHGFVELDTNDFAFISNRINSSYSRTSEFIIKFPSAYQSISSYWAYFSFDMEVSTLSKSDFASIELRSTQDSNWHLIADTSTIHHLNWFGDDPVFYGNHSRQHYCADLWYDVPNLVDNDTLFFRFKFTQDAIADNAKGILIDNIGLVDGLTSLDEVNGKGHFKVFPNPTNYFIRLQFDNGNVEFDYQLINIQGTVVQKGSVSNNQKIDMQYLNKGVYLLNLSDSESQWVHRIIRY